MNLELHYETGGHGGPYATLEEATETAKRLLTANCACGSRIEIRDGPGGTLVRTIIFQYTNGVHVLNALGREVEA